MEDELEARLDDAFVNVISQIVVLGGRLLVQGAWSVHVRHEITASEGIEVVSLLLQGATD